MHTARDELDLSKTYSLSTVFSLNFRSDSVLYPARQKAKRRKPAQVRYGDFRFLKALPVLDFSIFRKTNLIIRRVAHPEELFTLKSDIKQSVFRHTILPKSRNLRPPSHYRNLRDVFTLENICFAHNIQVCIQDIVFCPKQCKRKIFWRVLALHFLMNQQPHETVELCIHKTIIPNSRRLLKCVGEESVHHVLSGF